MLMEPVSEVLVKNMHTSRAVGHKGADTGHIAGLRPFYGPFELSSCNSLSPGIFTLLRLYWKTQQMAQQPFRNSAYGCPTGAGIAVKPEWDAGIISCYTQC